jgi:hypothetical protein
MKSNKLFLIFALFMVLLCCFSAVSASEDVTDDAVAVSDDATVDEVVSEVDSDDESIAVSNDENLESVDDSGNESLAVQDVEQVDDVDNTTLTAENENESDVNDTNSTLTAEVDDELSGQSLNNNIVYVGTEDTFYALSNNNLLSNGINELQYGYGSILSYKNEKLCMGNNDNILSNSPDNLIPEGTLTYDVFKYGDITYYLNGTYYIDSPIYLGINLDTGDPINNICIKPQDGSKATIIFKKPVDVYDPSLLYIPSGENITIENIKFTTTSDYANGYGIIYIIGDVKNLYFKNCTFENCIDNSPTGEDCAIFNVDYSYDEYDNPISKPSNVVINKCTFATCSNFYENIFTRNVDLINISNCIFEENTLKSSEILSKATIYLKNNQFDSTNPITIEDNGIIVSDVSFKVLTKSLTVNEAGSIVAELVDDNDNHIYSTNLKFKINGVEQTPTFNKGTGLYTVKYTPTSLDNISVKSSCSNIEQLNDDNDPILVKAITDLIVNCSDSAVYGSEFKVNATLDSTISGENITFTVLNSTNNPVKSVNTTITGGFASYSFTDLPAGVYTVVADYAGGTSFAPASDSKAFTIIQADSSVEIVVLNDIIHVGETDFIVNWYSN